MSSKVNWISGLKKALTADPKKTGALAVLLVLLLAALGQTLLKSGGRNRPESAGAAIVPQDPNTSLAAQLQAASVSAQRTMGISNALQKWIEAPVPPISHNLFSVRIEYFPFDGSGTTQSDSTDAGFWFMLEKSMAVQTDQINKRENLIANLTAQAAALRLQSTTTGPQPRAMVNGELVGEGSVVADFHVLKIEARRIIVEREGIRLEIQMK